MTKKVITNTMFRKVYKAYYDFILTTENPINELTKEINKPNMPYKGDYEISQSKIGKLWKSKSPKVKLYRSHLVTLAVYKHYYGYAYKTKVSIGDIDSFRIKRIKIQILNDYKENREFSKCQDDNANVA